MEEGFLRVSRTARYHWIGDPGSAREIWVVVHGYGQLARYFLNGFRSLEQGRLIVAPEGLSRFYLDPEHARVGATWMTREDRLNEIKDHIEYLDGLVGYLKQQCPEGIPVKALGFSQGTATAARWAIQGRTRLEHLVFWAGGLPPELGPDELSVWRDTHVDLVLGDKDPYLKPSDQTAMAQRLRSASVPHACHIFTGEHRLEPVLLNKLLNNVLKGSVPPRN